MAKHQELLENRFLHAEEDLLFNKSEDEAWSLFRTQGLNTVSLKEIAES